MIEKQLSKVRKNNGKHFDKQSKNELTKENVIVEYNRNRVIAILD